MRHTLLFLPLVALAALSVYAVCSRFPVEHTIMERLQIQVPETRTKTVRKKVETVDGQMVEIEIDVPLAAAKMVIRDVPVAYIPNWKSNLVFGAGCIGLVGFAGIIVYFLRTREWKNPKPDDKKRAEALVYNITSFIVGLVMGFNSADSKLTRQLPYDLQQSRVQRVDEVEPPILAPPDGSL